MSITTRIYGVYLVLLGASLALFWCFYVWGINEAQPFAVGTSLGWVTCFFVSRYLEKKEASNG
ncbi:MAG: hypothetical protein AAF559_00605 [Pseudomonadota bacterium]